jgi:hypothetical protein
MATMMPDEGLDIILGQFPFNTVKYTSPLNCGLFKSQTNTTVITHALTLSSITATTYTSYASQALAAATWGAAAEYSATLGRQMTYPQVTFATVGATGDTINGFYIMDNAAAKCIGQANFDDGLAVTVATNDVVKLTPTLVYKH